MNSSAAGISGALSANPPLPRKEWQQALAALPLLKGLADAELQRLKELAILLMHHKSFEGARGLVLTQPMILDISLQACLPILNLGLSAYGGWSSVIVYPAAFIPKRIFTDETGVVHQGHSVLAGEVWLRGPVILGWHDVASAGEIDGHNVVIHEFSHKPDMLNGAANVFRPCTPGWGLMSGWGPSPRPFRTSSATAINSITIKSTAMPRPRHRSSLPY